MIGSSIGSIEELSTKPAAQQAIEDSSGSRSPPAAPPARRPIGKPSPSVPPDRTHCRTAQSSFGGPRRDGAPHPPRTPGRAATAHLPTPQLGAQSAVPAVARTIPRPLLRTCTHRRPHLRQRAGGGNRRAVASHPLHVMLPGGRSAAAQSAQPLPAPPPSRRGGRGRGARGTSLPGTAPHCPAAVAAAHPCRCLCPSPPSSLERRRGCT